jgi:hypothetical protein
MENLRRLFLFGFFALAFLSYQFVDLSPLVRLDLVEAEDDAPENIAEVSGTEWERFFSRAVGGFEGNGDWAWRCGPDQEDSGISRRLYFKPREELIPEILEMLPPDGGALGLALGLGDQRIVIEARRWVGDGDSFVFGAGYSGLRPPDRFFRPFRGLLPWFLLLGVSLYLIWPAPKQSPKALVYARSRIILGDVVGLLLFSTFFFLPLLIVGSTTRAVFGVPVFTLIFWALAAFGVLIASHGTFYSVYAIEVEPEAIRIRTDSGWKSYAFADMKNYGPAMRQSPRWLRILLALAALTGRGGAAGAAALGATSSAPGIAVGLKDGRTLCVWGATPLGTPIIKGAEAIPKALNAAGVPETGEVFTYTGLGRGHVVGSSVSRSE